MADFPFKRIRLSHSALESLLYQCERKFQIERFLVGSKVEEDSPDFTFGTAWGQALQEYLLTGNLTKTIWKAFLVYNLGMESDKKSFWKLVYGIVSAEQQLAQFRRDYELVYFNDNPAIELGVRLLIDDTFYYVGFLDAVVRNKKTGKYCVVEGKSTASQLIDINPMYRYSGQGLGYSISLDTIVGEELAEYEVIYIVLQYPSRTGSEPKVHILNFEKNLLDRLQWFMTLQLDVQRIRQMLELNYFPKRVGACLSYNRPCPHFGLCHLHSLDKYKEEEPDPHEHRYSFTFNLEDVINNHLERVSNSKQGKPTEFQELTIIS